MDINWGTLAVLIVSPVVGWLVGWVIEYVVLGRLAKDTLVQRTLSGLGRWMGMVAGFGLSLRHKVLPPEWHNEALLGWEIISVFIATVFLARFVSQYFEDQTSELRRETQSASLIQTILRVAIYLIGLLVILQMLGVSITPMLTALGVGGLAVALALQDTLGNLFAGIQVIASRKIRPGDFIRLSGSGEEGYVTDITWRYTSVEMISKQTVIIPNSKLASAIVTNTSLPTEEITARLDLGVHYSSDLEHVESVTIETTRDVLCQYLNDSDADPNVRVRYRTFADSSINFSILFPVPSFADQVPVCHLLIKALHRRFAQEGIDIPFPIRTIELSETDRRLLTSKQNRHGEG